MRLVLLLLICAGCTGPYLSDLTRKPVVPDYPQPDRTYLVFDPGQGFRVEYFGTGWVWLWAAQAGQLVAGHWQRWDRHRIRMKDGSVSPGGVELCMAFTQRPPETLGVNDWDCKPILRMADQVVAVLKGDAFGLAGTDRPPYRLDACKPPEAFALRRKARC
ncbi:MAG: hypothetical protein D6754_14230 [Alphaproteobacteria bacterium]|nr:MAG: hypothetical protein D6754_14230 [Alphaproteobacteria bacterium]